MKTINEWITDTAKSFIGQREIKGNMGFQDHKFQDLMEAVGWEKGQAWCAYFTELVWKTAYQQYDSSIYPTLDMLFSAGALATYLNFKKSPKFIVDQNARKGDVVIWQDYKKGIPSWKGHAGIVIDSYKDVIKTVEGNTNNSGGREGIEVAEKMRDLDFNIKDGLVLKGFIHPFSY